MLNPNFILSIRILLIVVAAIALTVIIVTNKKINKQIKNCSGAEYYQTQRIILMFWIVVVMIVGICWNVLFELKKIIMEKNIKDYLHLYLGCETNYGKLVSINIHASSAKCITNEYEVVNGELNNIKPILRPLSDMSDEEMKELYHCNYLYGNAAIISEITKANFCSHNNNLIEISYTSRKGSGLSMGQELVYLNKLSAKQFKYLLSKHFDLFNLIEAGLAIDKTTLK